VFQRHVVFSLPRTGAASRLASLCRPPKQPTCHGPASARIVVGTRRFRVDRLARTGPHQLVDLDKLVRSPRRAIVFFTTCAKRAETRAQRDCGAPSVDGVIGARMTIAWFFPGQGSQSVGMAKDVLESSAAARAVFDQVDGALGEPLSALVLEGPEADLILTANAQPAIVATSCAILAAIKERYPALPAPSFAAGHSLGEYSALVAAGALTLTDAVRLVRARGQAMQDAVPAGEGAMAAIMGLSPDQVRALCKEASSAGLVSPANFNAPGQVVIAGETAAVDRARDLAAENKGKGVALKVSAPFHCALMAPAARALEARLHDVPIASLAFPVVANVDAQPNADASRVKDLLVRQVDGAVLWEDSVRAMQERGVTLALEIGPGKVLAGLTKRIAKEIKVLSVNDRAAIDQVGSFLDG